MPRRTSIAPRTRRRRLWIGLVTAFALVAAGTGIVVWRVLGSSDSATTTTRTVTVSEQTLRDTVAASGTVAPKKRADLSFAGSGTVTKVYVDVGDTVTKGNKLAAIDDDELRADLSAAKADYQAAVDDQATLADDSDATDAQLAAAASKISVQRAKVKQARSAVRAATLRAPIAGKVAVVDIAKGDSVGSSSGSGTGSTAGSGAASSSAAITVISTSRFTVTTSVGSADLASIKKGLQAEITPTGAREPVYGTVSSVAVMASSSGSSTTATSGGSATFAVVIDVTGKQKSLFAGATATVAIVVKQRDNVLTVPTAAITTTDGKTTVQKLVDGQPTATEISIGQTSGAITEVTKGLTAGDQVVVSTQNRPSGTSSGSQRTGQNQGGGGFNGGGGFPGAGGPPDAPR